MTDDERIEYLSATIIKMVVDYKFTIKQVAIEYYVTEEKIKDFLIKRGYEKYVN